MSPCGPSDGGIRRRLLFERKFADALGSRPQQGQVSVRRDPVEDAVDVERVIHPHRFPLRRRTVL